ncbi:MAG: SAM-dependent methyltransferase [Nocardioides sp.]|nr:SAM-dependent methyltransferase [Nocardioides sp.]
MHGDAFAPGVAVDDPARTVVVSSGLLHHLSTDGLEDFFAAQEHLGVAAFSHWDPAPGPWTGLGARTFHRARMREPLSRHDGVLSALRAHPAPVLRRAAEAAAPSYDVHVADPGWRGSLVEVVRPVWGVRR